jgi:hypothetical protein
MCDMLPNTPFILKFSLKLEPRYLSESKQSLLDCIPIHPYTRLARLDYIYGSLANSLYGS